MKKIKEIYQKWRESSLQRENLDSLLSASPGPQTDLMERLDWLVDLLQWIRSEGTVQKFKSGEMDFSTGEPQVLRVKYLLHMLDRQPLWKSHVAVTLRSLIYETSSLDILINTGIPQEEGLIAETFNRLTRWIIPASRHQKSLSLIFMQTFQRESDVRWISLLDEATFSKLIELFFYEQENENENWNSLHHDAEDALLILSSKIKAIGISHIIRNRSQVKDFKHLPFYQFSKVIENYIAGQAHAGEVVELITEARFHLRHAYAHLDDFGVDLKVVFKLEVLEAQLRRVEVLVISLSQNEKNHVMIRNLLVELILENLRSLSIRSLLGSNLSLIARKIVERSAETGEHYITRTPLEYFFIIRKALGGGLITGFTILVKNILHHIPTSPMGYGLLSTINYSVSFIAIQLFGFTLATKQPAMTAPALAARMHDLNSEKDREDLVDEIIFLVRSQLAAVAGNVIGVIPTVIFIDMIWHSYTGVHLMDREGANETIHSFSILGTTPFYAAFTGVLLWLSSVFSGWAGNWAKFHQLSQAIATNRRLQFTFGERQTLRFAKFIDHHFQGFASNISLAILLGMLPQFFKFAGIPLDVRHVTLSTAGLTASAMATPQNLLMDESFILAMFGIGSMAILNLAVAFSLAMWTATRARKVRAPERSVIYSALRKRLKKNPISLFYPTQ